jgi:GTPase SAR1 family protein
MNDYQEVRERLIHLNHEVIALIDECRASAGKSTTPFDQWKMNCDVISRQLTEHVVRIGVVGAIKSGKSTFINALLRNDYLKRGAGVVTSIVTRIRQGDCQLARLFFKSWDEINNEIEQALVLFPNDHWQPDQEHFDIRRKKDRTDLNAALDSLDAGLRVARDQLNANSVLLSSYIKGYDQAHDFIGPENETRELDARQLDEHRDFVGSDALAVYLKDVELRITTDTIGDNIELADCQGSDSPNPLHMAMIQDYLLKTHLIIYVISSRTGVRQADIRFLTMIKQMGIAENIIFVCNCDLNEHDGPEDLNALISRINEELSLIIAKPCLFSISALFHLFENTGDKLTERDKQRLDGWRRAEALVAFSQKENRRFQTALSLKLTRERSNLLLKNQLERLGVVLNGLHQWIRLNRELLKRDTGEARRLIDGIKGHQGNIVQIESMIQSTLAGAIQKKKQEIKKNIDRFFDRYSGTVLKNTITFIRNYDADISRFKEILVTSGFTQTMYIAFQSFKQSLDGFMAEKVNPEIIGFIGQEEKDLKDYLKKVAEPYEAMVKNTLKQYKESLAQFDMTFMIEHWELDISPDLDSLKQAVGLSIQPAVASMRYSANIKTEAVVRLGFYSIVKIVRRILKKPLGKDNEEELKALEDGIRRAKRETERSLIAHFKDYRENIKFQHMLRLADAASERLFESLVGNFRGYLSDLNALIDNISNDRGGKKQLDEAFSLIEKNIDTTLEKIRTLRSGINEWYADSSGEEITTVLNVQG